MKQSNFFPMLLFVVSYRLIECRIIGESDGRGEIECAERE